MTTALLFILIIGLLVFVHEFGHFFAARRSGVTVEEFGFGFPPKLWGIKRGATLYSINLIPFGGFVRLKGESAQQCVDPDSLLMAPFGKKMMIMVAGVTMNLLLAWLFLSIALTAGIKADPTDSNFLKNATIGDQHQELIVSSNSAAAAAGLQMGDQFISLDGQPFSDTESIIAYLKEINYRPISIKYQRGDQTVEQNVTPQPVNETFRYGFGIQNIATVSFPWYIAPWYGIQYTWLAITQTAAGFWTFISNLFSTGKIISDVSGPIGIAVFADQVRQIGLIAVVQFIAILSISLAFINIMPFPALDGGRALFIIIGRLRNRPINHEVESYFHATGFYLLIILLLLISYRDISNLGLIAKIKNFFQ